MKTRGVGELGEKQWNAPQESDIQNARMVVLDPYFRDESRAAARMCVQHDKPYVTLDCKYYDFLTQNAEAVVISHELRDQAYPNEDMELIFQKYQETCNGLIIFSFGSDDLWFAVRLTLSKNSNPFKSNLWIQLVLAILFAAQSHLLKKMRDNVPTQSIRTLG